ncbi:MAG: histidinol-phosphate transaminase [Cellvibrio sp.]
MSKFWSPIVHTLEPYVPGEQPKVDGLIKLNTNENPFPPSPNVARVIDQARVDRLRLYPDPNSETLKNTLADYYHVSNKNVFVGNGSDEVLALLFLAFFKQDRPILFPDISYSFYPVYCKLYGIDYETPALAEDFSINFAVYQKPNGGIILPNPNAPTSIAKTRNEIEQLLKANPDSLVVIDEAYIDFGGETAIPLTEQYDNLLVVQTLSKSRSLAGMRVGFAIGNEALINGLIRVKDSFNSYPLDSIAEAAAVEAFKDQNYFEDCCNKIIETREWTTRELEALGFSVLPSKANFIFAAPKEDAQGIFTYLREHKILVRYFNKPRINRFLRITIGTQAEMEKMIEVLKAR